MAPSSVREAHSTASPGSPGWWEGRRDLPALFTALRPIGTASKPHGRQRAAGKPGAVRGGTWATGAPGTHRPVPTGLPAAVLCPQSEPTGGNGKGAASPSTGACGQVRDAQTPSSPGHQALLTSSWTGEPIPAEVGPQRPSALRPCHLAASARPQPRTCPPVSTCTRSTSQRSTWRPHAPTVIYEAAAAQGVLIKIRNKQIQGINSCVMILWFSVYGSSGKTIRPQPFQADKTGHLFLMEREFQDSPSRGESC